MGLEKEELSIPTMVTSLEMVNISLERERADKQLNLVRVWRYERVSLLLWLEHQGDDGGGRGQTVGEVPNGGENQFSLMGNLVGEKKVLFNKFEYT